MAKDKYNNPKWIEFRKIILEIDNNRCQKCFTNKGQLCAHHIAYINGRELWEYPTSFLITLCSDCHNQWHRDNKAMVFTEEDFIAIKKLPKKEYNLFMTNLWKIKKPKLKKPKKKKKYRVPTYKPNKSLTYIKQTPSNTNEYVLIKTPDDLDNFVKNLTKC